MNHLNEQGWKFSRMFTLSGEVFLFESTCGKRRIEARNRGVKLIRENSYSGVTGVFASWELFHAAIAAQEYAKTRKINEWAGFEIKRLGPPGMVFGCEYYVCPPGRRESIKVGERYKGEQKGMEFTGKNEVRERPMPVKVSGSVTVSHDIWRVETGITPPEGWIVGEVYSLPDSCKVKNLSGITIMVVSDGSEFDLSSLDLESLKMIQPLYVRLQGELK